MWKCTAWPDSSAAIRLCQTAPDVTTGLISEHAYDSWEAYELIWNTFDVCQLNRYCVAAIADFTVVPAEKQHFHVTTWSGILLNKTPLALSCHNKSQCPQFVQRIHCGFLHGCEIE